MVPLGRGNSLDTADIRYRGQKGQFQFTVKCILASCVQLHASAAHPKQYKFMEKTG